MQTDNIVYTSSPDPLIYVVLIIIAALMLYMFTIMNVGRARARYKIAPPATSGHPDFERYFRVQQNTLEQLVLFIPSLILFAALWQAPHLASMLGLVWLAGRTMYMFGYYQSTHKRLAGFIIAQFTSVVLLLGSLVATVKAML